MTAESWLRQMREHVRASAVVIPADVNVIELGARTLLWAVLIFLGWSYVASPLMRSQLSPSFVHFLLARIDLVFHEAGHILFLPFGRFLSVLGGSLLQILIPLVCTYTFLLRHQNAFGASVTLWWTGQSFIELAPYVADASSQGLLLLGGVTGQDAPGAHDWNNLLSWTGLLRYDRTLGVATHVVGASLIMLALVWGGYLLWNQYEVVRDA